MLNKDIKYLKGVGEERAKLFAKLGIFTIEDMLYYFPRDYEDRSKYKLIEECENNETVCVNATVFSPVKEIRIRKGMTIYSMIVHDETGAMTIVWYNNRFVKNAFISGDRYTFYGKVSINRSKKEIISPIYEKQDARRYTGKIVPIYPLSLKLTQKLVQSTMEKAIEYVGEMEEYIPSSLRSRYNISEINFAMRNIHFPKDFDNYDVARRRFVFEELLIMQLALFSRKRYVINDKGFIFSDIQCVDKFISKLPFPLTNAQKRAIDEICVDLQKGSPMNRLVQGDVGSGKTVVAAAGMYIAYRNGYQSVIMAPTEILANQHYNTFKTFFEGLGVNIVLLTGSMKASEKREVNKLISNGDADIIVGTHAVIQKNVEYANVGLVIADEQHRFGVGQRALLKDKGSNPHIIIMSATPIPRTLALILYGDLNLSEIDELPPGRKAVKTYAVNESMRKRVYAFLEKNVMTGTQAYIICPLVEETEKSDLKNVVDFTEKLTKAFPHINIGLMHGKMKSKDKDDVMNKFVANEVQVLVSTTVIEVGVNVPNSNLMIIENAERFGLSQLHQLRGRVGRGSEQAHCILITNANNDITKKRMETMCMSNDGFYISEQDLKLRGPGDFFGTRQHGLPELKIANLFGDDRDILKLAQEAAKSICNIDPNLEQKENIGLKKRIQRIFSDDIVMN